MLAGLILVFAAGCHEKSHVPAIGTGLHLGAGQEFDDCEGAGWCPRMVVIPAGTFTMGAPASEPGYFEAEGPEHSVQVGEFAAGKFAVTRGQWNAFVTATSRDTRGGCTWTSRTGQNPDPLGTWRDPSFAQDDSHPVVCITWDDAQDYIRWLSQRTGHAYRLLTEAEWEYAARAGTTTAFPWGPSASHEFANYGADECCAGRASGHDQWVQTSPVGAFPPNAFGLHDMNGGALQFVQDCFAMSYAGLPRDGSAYEQATTLQVSGELAFMNGTSSCDYRILRGGNWGDPPALIRSAARNFAPPPGATLQDYRSTGVGFRVARPVL